MIDYPKDQTPSESREVNDLSLEVLNLFGKASHPRIVFFTLRDVTVRAFAAYFEKQVRMNAIEEHCFRTRREIAEELRK